MKQFIQPPPGQRTFALLMTLFIGTWAAVVAIIWVTSKNGAPVDSALLFGLAGLVGSINIPLITGQAYKSVQTARAQSGKPPKEEA